ncbi:CST complex subunit STN1 isoform X2 [Ambystoma mexicanum]|uniref:CST complex subunit STN1 isoform X2 n=1 Tax=Ambystoma mexicanum TaxID=8296 RepID=UPI0037E8EA63
MSGPGSFQEEPPVLLWGLDPVFRAFAKLYIKDILELKQSVKVSGVFFYKGHPIKQVDILGIVVYKREKENCFSYGVDDSTGVINCTCWKKTGLPQNSPLAAASSHQSTAGGLDLAEMLKKLQDEESRSSNIDIGDVISVRGVIKIYREQREIVSSVYHKVDDPAYDANIFRMLDVPYLYRNVYDLASEVPQRHDKDLQMTLGLTYQLSEQVEDFLIKDNIPNFDPRELETIDSLKSLINEKLRDTQVKQSCPSTKEVRNLFKEAILLLQAKGVVFLKSQNHDVYHVTDHDKELHKTTLNIIQTDCKRHRRDSGYRWLPWLLTPVRNPGTPQETCYNEAHIRTGTCI